MKGVSGTFNFGENVIRFGGPGKDRRINNCRISEGDSPIFVERKLGQSPTYSFAGPKRARVRVLGFVHDDMQVQVWRVSSSICRKNLIHWRRCFAMHVPISLPSAMSIAANSVVVPFRL
jgi:hypothetical protein